MAKLIVDCVLLCAFLWIVCEVSECRDVVRRRDVHRIILKEKSRSRLKKPTRPPIHDYRHEAPRDYHQDSHDHYDDQAGEYSSHHVRYHNNRHREHYRDYDEHKDYRGDYDKRKGHRYRSEEVDPYYNHQSHHDFDGYGAHRDGHENVFQQNYSDKLRESLDDYERYSKLMEQYNKRNAEDFVSKLENGERPIGLHGEQEETHGYPIPAKPPRLDSVKGGWSPMASLDLPKRKIRTDKNKIEISPAKPKNIEEIVELTTNQPLILPSIIVETNLTGHGSTNFDFDPENVFYQNHKYSNEKPNPSQSDRAKHRDKGSAVNHQIREGNSESTVSSILASFQHIAPAASTSYSSVWNSNDNDHNDKHRDVASGTKQSTYGSRTKSRRTKRPANVSD